MYYHCLMYFMHTNVDGKQSLSLVFFPFLPILVDAVTRKYAKNRLSLISHSFAYIFFKLLVWGCR